jgi:gliding motility-associated-like protein
VPEGIYYVDVTDNHGCLATDTFKINEPAELVYTALVVPVNCSTSTNGRITVTASGGVGPYSYTWRDLDEDSPQVTQLAAGTYKVSISDANGCSRTEFITVGTSGSLIVEASPDVMSVNIGTEIPFTVTGATNYQWSPDQYLSCSDCDNPLCIPTSSYNYIVTGSNPNGCTGFDTIIVNVFVDCHNLTLPNVFSPNNNGPQANNTFGLLGTLPCLETYQLLIFNRWGEQVFETQSTDLLWDGTYKGQAQNSGVYFYRLDMKLVNGEEVKKSGNLTLVR